MKPNAMTMIAALHASAASACSGVEPTSADGGPILVQVSGEDLATDGFSFPAGSEVTIADGWEIRFDHVIVSIGSVTLSEDPNLDPSDQSRTGVVVARASGPWAVDLHEEGTASGAGGEGTAVPLATIDGQTERGNAPFATDEHYAFSYETVAARDDAVLVNLDAEAEAAHARMVAAGYSVLLAGTATFRGEGCAVSDAAYDFTAIPRIVRFELGFAAPTAYVNCQNQDNDGDAFPDEEYARGVAVRAGAPVTAQLTFHVEHFLYSDVQHEPELYFDQIAARVAGAEDGTLLTMDHLAGVDPTAFVDAAGRPLPARRCDGGAMPSGTQRGFGVGSVPLDPSASPAEALRDYRDYVTYVTSTQGHLNGGEGICYARRNYPSPR